MSRTKIRCSRTAPWCFAVLTTVNLTAFVAGAETQVEKTSHAGVADGPLHAYVTSVDLPADGFWTVRAPEPGSSEGAGSIRELYLTPSQPSRLRQLGKRMYAALGEQQTRSGRHQVRRGFEACRRYAQQHGDVGPKTIANLADDKTMDYIANSWDKPKYRSRDLGDFIDGDPPEGPFIHLIPDVRFDFAKPKPPANRNGETTDNRTALQSIRKIVREKDRRELAFELRPHADDGLHWMLYTDGNCERVPIDAELVANQHVKIRPIISELLAKKASERAFQTYRLVMLSDQPITDVISIHAHNQVLEQNLQVPWDVASAVDTPYAIVRSSITDARKFAWNPYLQASPGGVLSSWNRSESGASPTANPRPNLSAFSVLGGRAAIEETLQLQPLQVTDSDEVGTVDIDSLKGVKVKSHPFEQMLGDQQGGSLDMARYVPADRFFVYVGKPESVSALLDTGAPFIASIGTAVTGNCLQYNLESRYLARLGMTRDWVDAVLTSGLTSEMAVFTPDLFFIDGTDVTIVARLRQPKLLRGLLGMLGASKLDTKSIVELPTSSGAPAFLALRDDLLFASTNRDELQQSIELHQQQGEGSLGDSIEFRYMLTQLDINENTRLYAYLSDPFVRRLVGPRTKIGQRRRLLEKAKMETLTARALLARLDGHEEPNSLTALVRSKHLNDGWRNQDLKIEETGLVRSQGYGTLPEMRTLRDDPLQKVTPEEAKAYKQYVDNYSRYWRRFFDPIAIRLDEIGTDQLELQTFILPLVDNSIYNGLRTTLAHQDDETSLNIPIFEPKPVVQFSASLNETAWEQIAGNFSGFFLRYSGASPAMLDDFGPGVHVAIFDADPIIALGSGDVFGAFGGNLMRGGGNQMMMAPVALSMLTRPCSIMVETKSPERTAQYLRQAAMGGGRSSRTGGSFNISFAQVGDRDEWVWTLDLFGVAKLRYGIEVVGKYMVIRNIPWSSKDKVVSDVPAELNAAMLQANPSACKEQLPGLFAAASDGNRRATMSGLGRLYPFMLSGSESVDQAATEHQRLFGFYPRQLGSDKWSWQNYRMVSDDYGNPTQQRQPEFDPTEPFGLMNRIDSVQLNMQFEQDGLRSTVRWRLR